MNAIKLPVKAMPGELFWTVRDAAGVDISIQQPASVAQQISLALNCHDALVGALVYVSAQGGNLSDDVLLEKTGPNDAVARGIMYVNARQIARAALAKVEDLRKP